jgi:hypothetical protein
MKKVSQTRQFSRDVKRMRKRGKDLSKLQEVVKLLAEGIPLNMFGFGVKLKPECPYHLQHRGELRIAPW